VGKAVNKTSSKQKQHRIPPVLRARAAEMRNLPTQPERILWQLLRKSQLDGLKFRRQAVIGKYIVDFCCPAHKLIVEVDGESHVGRADTDEARTRSLKKLGYRVMRVTNDDVLQDLEAVGNAILQAVESIDSELTKIPAP